MNIEKRDESSKKMSFINTQILPNIHFIIVSFSVLRVSYGFSEVQCSLVLQVICWRHRFFSSTESFS